MIKLSKRAWNNVIIVSMLMLIMLFNLSGDFLNEGSDKISSVHTLVPANMIITTMEFEQEKVERIGQGWRATSSKYGENHSNERLAILVEHWTNAEMISFDQGFNWQAPTSIVKLWFAGQALPIEYQFMQLTDKTLVQIDKKTYRLTSPNYQVLNISE
jgi:hypothetical protein